MYRWVAALTFAGMLSVWTGCATTQQQQQQNEFEEQGVEQGNDVNASFGQGNNFGNEGNGGQENFQGDQNAGFNNFQGMNGGNGFNDFSEGGNGFNNFSEGGNNFADEGFGENGEFVNNANSAATFDQGFDNGGNMLANNGGMNGVMMEEGAAGQDFGATVNNATELEDFGAMNGSMMNPAVPVEQPVVDASVNAVVDQSADMGFGAPAAAPMAGAMPGAGVVRYVLEGGTQLFADEQRTSVVKNLEQGDHPLVVENGEWARTSDGYYVSMTGLTERPIGRFKAPAEWR